MQDSGLAAIVGVLQAAEFLGEQWGGWMVSHSNSLQPRAIGYEKTPGPYGSERLNAGALKKLVLRTCANANVAQRCDISTLLPCLVCRGPCDRHLRPPNDQQPDVDPRVQRISIEVVARDQPLGDKPVLQRPRRNLELGR